MIDIIELLIESYNIGYKLMKSHRSTWSWSHNTVATTVESTRTWRHDKDANLLVVSNKDSQRNGIRKNRKQKNKTYYVGTKWQVRGVGIEYIHEAPYNPDQPTHRWRPTTFYENLTRTAIDESL